MNRVVHFEIHAKDPDKMDVSGVGWLAYCKDLEENIFGMLQPH